jgi:hypothetical protein
MQAISNNFEDFCCSFYVKHLAFVNFSFVNTIFVATIQFEVKKLTSFKTKRAGLNNYFSYDSVKALENICIQ